MNELYFPFAQSFVNPPATNELISQPVESGVGGSPQFQSKNSEFININEFMHLQQQQDSLNMDSTKINDYRSRYYQSSNPQQTKILSEITEKGKNSHKNSKIQIPYSPLSPSITPLVMAMGKIQDQSNQQMRKFERIQGQGKITTINALELAPVRNIQRDAQSMVVSSKKAKILKKHNMHGLDTNQLKQDVLKLKANSNNIDEQFQIVQYQSQLPSIINESSWNANLQKRNNMQKNIYNHKSSNNHNPHPYHQNIQLQNQINQKSQKRDGNYNQGYRNQMQQLVLNQQQSEDKQKSKKHKNFNKTANLTDSYDMDQQIINQARASTNQNRSPVHVSDNHIKLKSRDSSLQKLKFDKANYQQQINQIINNQKYIQQQYLKKIKQPVNQYGIPEIMIDINKFIKDSEMGRAPHKPITSTLVNQYNTIQHDGRYSIQMGNQSTLNQSSIMQTRDNQTSNNLRRSYMNMKIDASQLEQLDNEDLEYDKRQEIIYHILKKQLDQKRREIVRYRKMKREMLRQSQNDQNKNQGPTQPLISEREKRRQQYEEERMRSLSPELVKIINNLTKQRHHNKYCRCCRYDSETAQLAEHLKLANYDPNYLIRYMKKIKYMNQKLYEEGGAELYNRRAATGQQTGAISLRKLAHDDSRNIQQIQEDTGKTQGSKLMSDNSFVKIGGSPPKGITSKEVNIQTRSGTQPQFKQKSRSPGTSSNGKKSKYAGSNHRQTKNRLLGYYNKERHICSTNHNPSEMANRTMSANKTFSPYGRGLEFIDMELRPVSEPPSMRDACLSALDFSFHDMSMQVDPKDVAEQILQTMKAEVRSIQMETLYSGKMVDAAIETEKEVDLRKRTDGSFGIIEMFAEQIENDQEYVNYDWKQSGLYELIQNQYDQFRGKQGAKSQKSLKEQSQQEENMQDASAYNNTKNDLQARQEDINNLNPDKEDIYTEMEVQYMATLLKKKAQSYNNKDMLGQVHVKARKTLEVLNDNLISGDVPIKNIFQFYKEPKRENIIRLLLRCKKMYEARVDVKKILMMMITWTELRNEIQTIREQPVKKFRQSDMDLFTNGMQVLRRIERELNVFKQEHKIFSAKFIFRSNDQYNEIPSNFEELGVFIQLIKELPQQQEEQVMPVNDHQNSKGQLKGSNSSQNLKKQNPLAFMETYKVFEEDRSLISDAKELTMKHSQLGGFEQEYSVNDLEYFDKSQIDYTSQSHTPKMLKTYMNDRRTPELNESMLQVNNNQKKNNKNYSSKTSQVTRQNVVNRYNDEVIKEEFEYMTQFNDEEINAIQIQQSNAQSKTNWFDNNQKNLNLELEHLNESPDINIDSEEINNVHKNYSNSQNDVNENGSNNHQEQANDIYNAQDV
ncbi:UNKNOWN [Stylonychia lemnae]|uniref:Uncharacterized protein n=1 Tax=Stylonychia lemnae TaxID=5949 RepID=A0A078BDG1_STYLE|nr:UNKNOWN [Stylonychia lemnae]|eukprot:CDW91237.1 UNKNOWN [Stylonychia lemnae]